MQMIPQLDTIEVEGTLNVVLGSKHAAVVAIEILEHLSD